MKPQIKSGDYHLIVNDSESRYASEMKCFNANGILLWTIPCLAKGQHPDYTKGKGDTPPGWYKLNYMVVTQPGEPANVWNAYGKYFWDMSPGSGAEEKYGRSGVGLHGGGSALENPLAPNQQLLPTWGCIRITNSDAEKKILPLWQETQKNKSTIYITVNQF